MQQPPTLQQPSNAPSPAGQRNRSPTALRSRTSPTQSSSTPTAPPTTSHPQPSASVKHRAHTPKPKAPPQPNRLQTKQRHDHDDKYRTDELLPADPLRKSLAAARPTLTP